MKQFQHQKHNKPEEVKDKLYLPSEVQNLAGNKQVEAYHEPHYFSQDQLYQEAEKDLDKIYHSLEGLVNHADLKERVVRPERPVIDPDEDVELHEKSVYMTPEEDKDGLYAGDFTGQVLQVPVMDDLPKVVYTEPEEDQDHLFHS